MFMVTTNDVPGYRVTQVLGEVMGLTVRSTNFGQGFTAGFRALGGGEIPEFTKLMYESRYEVMNRMWGEAVQRGANAVIAMRFDSGSLGSFSEMCAYGTAVVIEPIDGAVPAPAQPAAPPAPPVA
ncbi:MULTISPECIES: YbjQ family protein [unclassified Microbacterium]|uniref:YbjQ family protein n=1 Tax=unclassified Microbacterium TaxID=2609290 RepID=UPI001E509A2F|nr:YbjQ family protein [Microbacterium sp. Au-Mic1]MCE4026319.1 YbjQ family protein [Microbacterium sp. Au-Mic1]